MKFVGVDYLSELYGCTDRTIQLWAEKWEAGGIVVRNTRNEYDLAGFIKQRNNELLKKIDELENGDANLSKLKQENMKLKNIKDSLEVKRLLGELVNYDDVRIAWVGETKIFRKTLNAMVPKLESALEGVTERARRRQIIHEHVREVLNMLSENLRIVTEDPENLPGPIEGINDKVENYEE